MMHRKDKQDMNFCEMDFGASFLDKRVRDRAIADRVDAIKYSHS